MSKETYLSDGLYASIVAGMIKLRAPRETGDHVVFLEPEVLEALNQFVRDVRNAERS